MGSGRSGLYSGAYASALAPVAGELVLRSETQQFFDNISRRTDIDPNGQFDVVGHGSPVSIQIEIDGVNLQLDARTVSKLLAHNGQYSKKQPIRLISCLTGAKSDGFAQNMANKLNTVVFAPTDLVWAYPNGRHIVAPRDPRNPNIPHPTKRGRFVPFYPGGKKK